MASRLHRLIRIVRILRRKSYPSVQQLCETLQVKERTIFNDLKELKEELGVDVLFDRTRRGYFLGTDDLELGFSTLTEETALLLVLACRLLASHGGEELAAPLEDLFADEIRHCLGLSTEEIKGIVRTNHSCIESVDPQMLVRICRACIKSESLHLRLHNGERCPTSEGLRLSQLIPVSIIVAPEDWKVVFHDGQEREKLELSLSCIEKLDHGHDVL